MRWWYDSQSMTWRNGRLQITSEFIADHPREFVETVIYEQTPDKLPEEAWPVIRDPDMPRTVAEMEALIIKLLNTPRGKRPDQDELGNEE